MPDPGTGDTAPPAAASEPAGDNFTPTVVYIEDNTSNATLLRRIMARRPRVRLLVATDGAAGLAVVHRMRPDLMLLDLHLPVLSGQEVLAAVRADVTWRCRRLSSS